MSDNSLSQRIINLRESKDWSQAELARRVGFDKSQMNKIENGSRKVSTDELAKFAQLFDVTTDYLLGNSEQKKPSPNSESLTEDDLDKMLDSAMSFDGEPMTDHDREVIRAYLKGRFGDKSSK